MKKQFSSKLELNLANISMQAVRFFAEQAKTIKVETNYRTHKHKTS
jgi:hypothetical protein